MFSTTYDAENHIWSGPKIPPTYNPEHSLGSLLLTCLEQRASNIAQICADTGVALTGKQFRDRAIIMAQYIQKMKLTNEDFVGFVTYNTENLVPTVYGCYIMGIPISPLSPMMAAEDIVKVYSIVKPKVIFCDKRNLKTVQEAVDMMKINSKILTIMEKVEGYESATNIIRNAVYSKVDEFVPPIIHSDSLLGVICSSGTTGTPKRIAKTHRDLIYEFATGWKLKHLRPAVFLTTSPIFWITGFNSTICATLNHATNVISSEMSHPTEEFIDIIRRYKVTYLTTLPFMLSHILDTKNLKPFEHVECWMIGGFASTKTLCEKFAPYLPNGKIWITYGLSEIGIISCNTTTDYDSIGYLNQNVEIKLITSSGKSIGPNELGEMMVRNKNFSGYHGDPAKTAEATQDGWFNTGDIVFFDNENRLHYVDRKVEIMNYEGCYIIPHEIEAIINEVDGVVNCAIVGILEKESMNHIVHAFIVPDESKNIREKSVLNYVNSKVIEEQKLHGGVHFIKNLPLGRTGKADKIKLREMAMQTSA